MRPSTEASPAVLLNEEFFTPGQLAQFLGKSERTIDWWREDRQGPPYLRVGRTILYKKSSVLKWLVDSEVMPRKSRKGGAR